MLQILRPSPVLAGAAATSVLVWCLATCTLINNTDCTIHTHMLARPVCSWLLMYRSLFSLCVDTCAHNALVGCGSDMVGRAFIDKGYKPFA